MSGSPVPASVGHALPLTVRGRNGHPRLAHAIARVPALIRQASFQAHPISLPGGGRALSGDGCLWVREADAASHGAMAAMLSDLRLGAIRMGSRSQLRLRAPEALVAAAPLAFVDPDSATRAAAALSSRLSTELVLREGSLLRRVPWPLVHFRAVPGLSESPACSDPFWPAPVLPGRVSADGRAPHFDPRGWSADETLRRTRSCADATLAALDGVRHRDDDVVGFANEAPQLLVLLHRAYGMAGSRDHEEALWPYVELGAVDAVRGEDVASSVEACMAAALPLVDRIPTRSARAGLPLSVVLFVERVARPALAPPAPAEDAEHLGMLSR